MMFLDYADTPDGNLIHVTDATPNDDLRCPYCDAPVFPKRGPQTAPHFAHYAGQSCRPAQDVFRDRPLVTCYQSLWLSLTDGQRAALATWWRVHRDTDVNFKGGRYSAASILYQALGTRCRKSLEMLIERGFLVEANDDPWAPTYRIGLLGKILNAETPCADFYAAMQAEQVAQAARLAECDDAAAETAKRILAHHARRLESFTLYLLHVRIAGTPYCKIGVTGREVALRVREVESMTGGVANVLLTVPGAGVVEGYVKARFQPFRAELGSWTEFFVSAAQERMLEELRGINKVGGSRDGDEMPESHKRVSV